MAKKSDNKNNFLAAVNAAKVAFETVRAALKEYEEAEASEKKRRLSLLEAIYKFVEERRADQKEVLKAFVRDNNETWAKPAEKNHYQPIVKIVFPNRAASTHSWYSQVLGYANAKKVPIGKLSEWLQQHEGGIDGAYAAAVVHFGSGRGGGATSFRNERLKIARERFEKAEASTSFKITAPVDVRDGFVIALVRIGADGEARVVEVVEQNQEQVEDTLLKYVQDSEVIIEALKDKPLFELYRAVSLVHGVVPLGAGTKERVIVAVNGTKGGKEKTRLFAASREMNQAWAEVTLKSPLPELPKGKLYYLSQKHAGVFRGQFAQESVWEIQAPEEGKSEFPLVTTGERKVKVKFQPLEKDAGDKLYVSDEDGKRTTVLTLNHSAMTAFINGVRDLRERVDKANEKRDIKQAVPKLMKLSSQSGRIVGTPLGVAAFAFTLFEAKSAPAFSEERFLEIEAFERVCEALLPYGQNIQGWMLDKDVRDSALLFKHAIGSDELTMVLPLLISTSGDRVSVCKELVLDEKAPA